MEKITIINNLKITQNVNIISFHYDVDYLPGQVIGISEDPLLPPRLYSICNAPGNRTIQILFDIKSEGRLTPRLAEKKPGDYAYSGGITGNFTCPDNEKAFWIAAGTGIAPFTSMFFSGNTANKYLIHGGRNLESFYFQDDFEPVLRDKYIRCCTREKGKGIFNGRLTNWLKEQNELPADYKYYLCGSAEMVVQTRDILVSKGIAFDSIMAEIYF